MIYAFIYLLLSFCILFFSIFPNKKKEVKVFYCFLLFLFLFAGFRQGIGPDYESYLIEIYRKIPSFKELILDFSKLRQIYGEYLFLIFNVFLKSIGVTERYYYCIFAAINIFLLKKILRERLNKNILIALLTYLSFYFLRESMGQIRQGISTLICLYSIKYIEIKNFKKFLISILISTFIQSSALIFIPAYYLYGKKKSKRIMVLFLIISLVIYEIKLLPIILLNVGTLLPNPIFSKIKSTLTISKFGVDPGFSKMYIMNIVVYISLLFIRGKKNNNIYSYCNLYCFGILIYFIFLNIAIYASRFSEVYMIISILLVPLLIDFKVKKNSNKYIIIVLYVLFLSLFYMKEILDGKDLYLPYKNWLFNIFI